MPVPRMVCGHNACHAVEHHLYLSPSVGKLSSKADSLSDFVPTPTLRTSGPVRHLALLRPSQARRDTKLLGKTCAKPLRVCHSHSKPYHHCPTRVGLAIRQQSATSNGIQVRVFHFRGNHRLTSNLWTSRRDPTQLPGHIQPGTVPWFAHPRNLEAKLATSVTIPEVLARLSILDFMFFSFSKSAKSMYEVRSGTVWL